MMNQYEQPYWQKQQLVIGLDEAGRGPLAGPLVVAGVIFPIDYHNELINDSKKLSEKQRERLYDVIVEDSIAYYIEIVDEKTVDQLNIYQATKQAMSRIITMSLQAQALTDAMPIMLKDVTVTDIVKGDQKSISIAAASILAKVTRDRIMIALDQQYPQYHFAKHKGYPTKEHLMMLKQYGPSPVHRYSFGPVQKSLQLQLFDDR